MERFVGLRNPVPIMHNISNFWHLGFDFLCYIIIKPTLCALLLVNPDDNANYLNTVQDDRSKTWRVQAVAVSPDSFESRKALASQWRGLRDDELSKDTGIPGCVFVHMSGFIGGNQTYEGALAMARASLKL